MSGCIDQIACSCNVDWDGKRNGIASIVAGALFFSAWWIVLDTAMVVDKKDWNNLYFILTIASSVSMFLLNSVSNSQVRGDSMNESVLGVTGARLWLLLSFGLSFACVFAAVGLLFNGYIQPGDHVVWPGVTLLLHNLMIFAASLVYKFGRVEDMWMI